MPVQQEGIKWDFVKGLMDYRLKVSGELNTDNTDATGFSQMAVVTDCPPETGATSEAEGVDCFPFSVRCCKDTTMPYVSEKWREITCNGWQ